LVVEPQDWGEFTTITRARDKNLVQPIRAKRELGNQLPNCLWPTPNAPQKDFFGKLEHECIPS
jgi:hypothetical protein